MSSSPSLSPEQIDINQQALRHLRMAGICPEVEASTDHIATMFDALASDVEISRIEVQLGTSFTVLPASTRHGDVEAAHIGWNKKSAVVSIPVMDTYSGDEVTELDLPSDGVLFVARSPETIHRSTLAGLQRAIDMFDSSFVAHNEVQTRARQKTQQASLDVYSEWYKVGHISTTIMAIRCAGLQSLGGTIGSYMGMIGLGYAQKQFQERQRRRFEHELVQMPADVSARLAAERSGEFERAITIDRKPEYAELQVGKRPGGRLVAYVDPYASTE